MTCKVLLCDDERNVRVDWHERVDAVVARADHYTLLPQLENGAVQCAIKELFARELAARDGDTYQRSRCVFDDADILVLDYDLLYVDKKNARHTGESLARLARAFSAAQVVVVVNQFRDAQFDLSLRGHLASHADLNLDAALIDTPGLWVDPPWDGFRPWHWHTLYRAVDSQRARQAWVENHWDSPIVDALGMRDDDLDRLNDSAVGFIGSNIKNWQELRVRTFKNFVCQPANGWEESAVADSRVAAARFAGARIGKWLERQVLAPQDALIDLPHLIQRFPFLLGDDVAELEAWNATVHSSESVKDRMPDDCWFEPRGILSRPAVWSQRFEDAETIREKRRSFDFGLVPPFVFLEDTSTFAHIDEAKQFRAGHHNVFDRRFVKYLSDYYTYAPQRRLAFAE